MNPYIALWLLICMAGATLSVVLIAQAGIDLRALGAARNGRRIRVWGRLAQETTRFIIHSSFFFVGLPFLNTPVGPDGPGVVVLVLIAGQGGYVLNSVVSLVVRFVADDVPVAITAGDLVVLAEEAGVAEELIALARILLNRAEESVATGEQQRVEVGRMADAAERQADTAERQADATEAASEVLQEMAKGSVGPADELVDGADNQQ